MKQDADGLGADFERWRQLTDDYEAALDQLARGEPGARERVVQLSHALRQMHPETAHAGPG
jgi:hypothetical protein